MYECSFHFRNASFFNLLLRLLSISSFQPILFTSVLFTCWFLHVIFIIYFLPKCNFCLLCTYLTYDENGELPTPTPNPSPNTYILLRHCVSTWSFSDNWLRVIYKQPKNCAYWLTLKKETSKTDFFSIDISFILCLLFRQSTYYELLDIVNKFCMTMILNVNGLDCKQNEWDSVKILLHKSRSAGMKTGSSSCFQVAIYYHSQCH